jgi:hypothetical protein
MQHQAKDEQCDECSNDEIGSLWRVAFGRVRASWSFRARIADFRAGAHSHKNHIKMPEDRGSSKSLGAVVPAFSAPLSPLLSNLVLDDLDKELTRAAAG